MKVGPVLGRMQPDDRSVVGETSRGVVDERIGVDPGICVISVGLLCDRPSHRIQSDGVDGPPRGINAGGRWVATYFRSAVPYSGYSPFGTDGRNV